MADRKIRMVLLDNLTPDDLLKLKHGGFFDGVAMPMPGTAHGQEATMKVKDPPGVERVREVPVTLTDKLDPGELANTSASMRPVIVPTVSVTTPAPVGATTTTADEPKPAKAKRAKVADPVPTPDEVIKQTNEVAAADDAPAPVVEEAPAAARSGAGALDIGILSGLSKLRDVLDYLHNNGVATADLASKCEELKAQLPLLQRINDIGPRVERAIAVMGLS